MTQGELYSDYDQWNTRSRTIERIKFFAKHGFKYVVRDENSNFLTLFSIKPKRYTKYGDGFWGYPDGAMQRKDLNCIPAQLIKNRDITEISYHNKSATLIKDFLKQQAK